MNVEQEPQTAVKAPKTPHRPIGIATFGLIFTFLGLMMVTGGHPVGGLLGLVSITVGSMFILTAVIRGAVFGWSPPKIRTTRDTPKTDS